jgi:hypothetical protein
MSERGMMRLHDVAKCDAASKALLAAWRSYACHGKSSEAASAAYRIALH